MRRGRWIGALLSVFVGVAGMLTVPAPLGAADESDRRVVIRYADWVPAGLQTAALQAAGVPDDQVVSTIPQLDAAVVEIPATEADALEDSEFVADVTPDVPVQLQAVPDDPYIGLTPALGDVGAAAAWDVYPGAGGFEAGPFSGASVAVVDSGIDPNHEEFQAFADKVPVCETYPANPLFDPVNCYNGATDTHAHGTHIAGIIGSVADNTAGTAGIAANSPLHVYKVCQITTCWTADIANAIVDATDDGADVINLSLGGDTPEGIWKDAVRYARERDVVVTAAAGNDGTTRHLYPASFDGVISVGATNSGTAVPAGFSRRNDQVDIAAPGTSIWAPVAAEANGGQPNGYKRYSGTSQSTAYVSGAAALVRSAHPEWDAGRTIGALLLTANDIGDPGRDDASGRGLLAVGAAVAWEPVSDGDLDDDGITDGADAEPYDPTMWPVGDVVLDAQADGASVRLWKFTFFGVTLFEMLLASGNGHFLLSTTVSNRVGSGLHAATITGGGLSVSGAGARYAPYALVISAPSSSPATLHLEVGGTVVADGRVVSGTVSVETP